MAFEEFGKELKLHEEDSEVFRKSLKGPRLAFGGYCSTSVRSRTTLLMYDHCTIELLLYSCTATATVLLLCYNYYCTHNSLLY